MLLGFASGSVHARLQVSVYTGYDLLKIHLSCAKYLHKNSYRVPKCQKVKNHRLGLYGIEHSKCNHLTTLGFKGLARNS